MSPTRTQTRPAPSLPEGAGAEWTDSVIRYRVIERTFLETSGPCAALEGSIPACSAVGSSWMPARRLAPAAFRCRRSEPERSHHTRTTERRSVAFGASRG
jgi:hypothetical protein